MFNMSDIAKPYKRLIRSTMHADDPRGILWVGGYTTGFDRGLSAGVSLACLIFVVVYVAASAVL